MIAKRDVTFFKSAFTLFDVAPCVMTRYGSLLEGFNERVQQMAPFRKKLKKHASDIKEKAAGAKKCLDQKLLELASSELLSQARKRWASQVKDVKLDHDFMMGLATQILEKAKGVREGLTKDEIVKSSKTVTADVKKKVVRKAKQATSQMKKKKVLAKAKKSRAKSMQQKPRSTQASSKKKPSSDH